MIKKLSASILLLFAPLVLHAQHPDWSTLVMLDEAPLIVTATMHVDDLQNGLGHLEVSQILKGNTRSRTIKVIFSDRHERTNHTKQLEKPKYWYSQGQQGVWLLSRRDPDRRFDLRYALLYYDIQWTDWIKTKLEDLSARVWTNHLGLSGSVIVDDVGRNKGYRFFYLCLRNDRAQSLFVNRHYRSREKDQQRIRATITTPNNEVIDLIKGDHNNCRLAGEPGWPEPLATDFVELQPGKTIYLPASGDMKCFMSTSATGQYIFQASYSNYQSKADDQGEVWKGEISFPLTVFSYSNTTR